MASTHKVNGDSVSYADNVLAKKYPLYDEGLTIQLSKEELSSWICTMDMHYSLNPFDMVVELIGGKIIETMKDRVKEVGTAIKCNRCTKTTYALPNKNWSCKHCR